MKKREKKVYFMLLVILILSCLITEINLTEADSKNITITGEVVTGKATSQQVSMNITVIGLPILSIITPENKTYLTNESLLLNYSSGGASMVWYNLDNSANITITSAVYFNTTQGSHILYLYANNSYGNFSSRNVSFSVNSTKFRVIYDEYKGSAKGNSTDFIIIPYEDMQNLSSVVLENANYGKINFKETINLTDDSNPGDNILDLDRYINVSFNRIEVNSSALPNFNKSAALWLYGLTFTNPRILRNGVLCPSDICIEESYSGGILKFNVTSFAVYSSEETSVEVPSPAAPAVSGGGEIKKIKHFILDKEEIKIKMKQGETKKQELTIKNIANQKIKITIENPKLKEFIRLSEESFELNAGESKTIILDFIAREDVLPDLYIGKLIIKTEEEEKEVLIAIEIESKKPLFDVKVKIPEQFLTVLPGEKLLAEITIFNLGEIKAVDVKAEFFIKNEDGEIILSSEETIAVEKQTSFIKEFYIPETAKYGKYAIYVKITHKGNVSSASAWFSIGKLFLISRRMFFIIIIILIVITFVLYMFFKTKKEKKTFEISGKPRISDEKREDLKDKLYALEKAYSSGYIGEEAYKQGKERIGKLSK